MTETTFFGHEDTYPSSSHATFMVELKSISLSRSIMSSPIEFITIMLFTFFPARVFWLFIKPTIAPFDSLRTLILYGLPIVAEIALRFSSDLGWLDGLGPDYRAAVGFIQFLLVIYEAVYFAALIISGIEKYGTKLLRAIRSEFTRLSTGNGEARRAIQKSLICFAKDRIFILYTDGKNQDTLQSYLQSAWQIEASPSPYGQAPELLREPLDSIWKESESFEPERGQKILQKICRNLCNLFTQPHRPRSIDCEEIYSVRLQRVNEIINVMKLASKQSNRVQIIDDALTGLERFNSQIEGDIELAVDALAIPLNVNLQLLLEREPTVK